MPRKSSTADGALFVRLPAAAVDKLDRASEVLGMRKKDLIAGLVTRYVNPDSPRALNALGTMGTRKVTVELGDTSPTVGSYSFQPYDTGEAGSAGPPPEVMTAEQAGQFLQLDEGAVVDLAERGQLPGRKLGTVWRFSRAALVAWLGAPEAR
jgi:excisionase family DNA binding protein